MNVLRLPELELLARQLKRPLSERINNATFFRHRDEVARLNESACVVTPAQERFEPGWRARRSVDLRLKHQEKFVVSDTASHIGFVL